MVCRTVPWEWEATVLGVAFGWCRLSTGWTQNCLVITGSCLGLSPSLMWDFVEAGETQSILMDGRHQDIMSRCV